MSNGLLRSGPRVLLVVGILTAAAGVAEAAPSDADPALVEAGRRIYEQGVLPDGSPLQALRPEGLVLEGRQAACVTCHRESGMGSVEGSLVESTLVPPVVGPLLFAPARFYGGYLDVAHHWVPNAAWERSLTRGAYDRQSLARALREGLDPDGQRLVAPMPRFPLDDTAVAALESYLRQLATGPTPGMDSRLLHLAAVVTPYAPPGQARTVLGVLRAWIAGARFLDKRWQLHVWELKGPPEGWGGQLLERYRQQPVFALLSGAGGARWRPVHRFCEDNRIACILPALEVAPEDPESRYAVYFSPGVTLEARVLAAHLVEEGDSPGTSKTVVQLYTDASGQQAAATLRERLEGAGRTVVERVYRNGDPTTALKGMPGDAVLVLWLRPPELQHLLAVESPEVLSGSVYLSALLAPPERLSLPDAWRPRVTFVSLSDDLGIQAELARLRMRRWLKEAGLPPDENPRVAADTYAACYLLNAALAGIKGEEVRRHAVPLNREHLLEWLERVVNKYSDGSDLVDPDSHVAQYGRMSLAPGQRMAVRGGILLRYAAPQSRRLVAQGRRIVP